MICFTIFYKVVIVLMVLLRYCFSDLRKVLLTCYCILTLKNPTCRAKKKDVKFEQKSAVYIRACTRFNFCT